MTHQRRHWNRLYAHDATRRRSDEPSLFARNHVALIAPGSLILELGCGSGRDAQFFVELGHTVCATDFSTVALTANQRRHTATTHSHSVALNTAAPLPFRDATFDVVYAHLSLHYFSDAVTKRVFREIRRVLRPDGLLCFFCKSIDDPLYGQGRRIEPDMFELDGHVRHFFSEDYARSCLGEDFHTLAIEQGRAPLSSRAPAFVLAIARAI